MYMTCKTFIEFADSSMYLYFLFIRTFALIYNKLTSIRKNVHQSIESFQLKMTQQDVLIIQKHSCSVINFATIPNHLNKDVLLH